MEASWNFLPDLINDSIDMGNFNPGRNKTVLKGKYNYGLNICYDDYFSQDSAIFSKKDVDLIVSLHNDIWINNPRFQWNHFRQSLLRSIETGISSVRTANGGLSGFARPDGSFRITDGAEGIQVLEVPLVKNNTLYPFLRDRLFILISAVAILLGYVRPYKKL
jgi:apolipoprotein N-acyltransferase